VPVGFGGLLDVALGARYWNLGDDGSVLSIGFELGFLVFFQRMRGTIPP